jgi:hypothetical protein
MLLARANASRFVQGLAEGDPVAWGILVLVVLFTAIGGYYKLRG